MIKMKIDIAKLGERGQVVIPQEIREELKLKLGMKLLVLEENGKIILEPIKDIKMKIIDRIREDLVDLKIAEKRLKEMEQGKYEETTKEEFLKEIESW